MGLQSHTLVIRWDCDTKMSKATAQVKGGILFRPWTECHIKFYSWLIDILVWIQPHHRLYESKPWSIQLQSLSRGLSRGIMEVASRPYGHCRKTPGLYSYIMTALRLRYCTFFLWWDTPCFCVDASSSVPCKTTMSSCQMSGSWRQLNFK